MSEFVKEQNIKRVPPILPKRDGIAKPRVMKKDYNYSELILNNVDAEQIHAIVIGARDLHLNMDKLIELLNKDVDIQLEFRDYESAVYIDKILKNKIDNDAFLIDDTLRIDRSYIDLTVLKNINLTIPLNYLMWGIRFNETVNTYCYQYTSPTTNYVNLFSDSGNVKISRENLVKIQSVVEDLYKMNPANDIEKVALVSDYIQSRTQYIAGDESESIYGTYVTPDFPVEDIYIKKRGLIETVLNNNNGVCVGIANTSTVLLNNPLMNVEVESLFGDRHSWNKVLIDGKYYYFDNTWAITRSDNMSEEGLVTLSFNKKYLLLGQNTINSIGHHHPEVKFVYNGIISEDDYNNIDYQSQFEYLKKPIYRSYKKND